jgi:tetratricopeptide (TPR) repeat protein
MNPKQPSFVSLRRTTAALLCAIPFLAAADSSVTTREQDIVIPTYLAGEPEPNPMFYFGRNSQGAEGRIYPYPLYDTLTHVQTNKTYRMVYLENEYLRIGILPDIGGRLFEAVDKSNGYNFIYRQHVIKPALIGLIGAWISGGIEWNIPHHHRASTFLPVQYRVETNADGGRTIWVGELELRQRMRWAVGYTLHPGKSYLECSLRILNRTPVANTMLCFANVAVSANNNYQVIFPPSTQWVTGHGKHDFTSWPIVTGRSGGSEFPEGTDVSWYANHPNSGSMFAWNYDDDFFAGYDHGRQAGILSIADHHFVSGKKFWTWGSGPRGHLWDHILTDEDGPYIELMVGAYSDNQPDYSWLQPYETKSFQMNWYPFRDIDGVKNANLDAAVNLDITNNTAKVGFCVTSAHDSAKVLVTSGSNTLLQENISISPGKPYVKQIPFPQGADPHELRAALSVDGRELVSYSPVRLTPMEMPKPVVPPPAPAEIKTVEELYLAGQRIEQFHAPGASPEPYWEEALRRDPGDARVNTAFGIRRLKAARFAEAEQHFRKALERLTASYTDPKDGEPFYYLGLALKAQGQTKTAEDAFAKATWSEAWRGPAYYAMAEIATGRGDFTAALDYLDRSLDANGLNLRALTLKAAVLRHTGRTNEALAVLSLAAQKTDPLDVRIMAERWLAGDRQAYSELIENLDRAPATGLETAFEFNNAGLFQDAAGLLTLATLTPGRKTTPVTPLAYYSLQSYHQSARGTGDAAEAAQLGKRAAELAPDYVFPFQWEAIPVLRRAIEANPRDARAPYYLGNLLFDWQPAEALKLWEQSARLDPSLAIVHRNIATALVHQQPSGDTNRAIAELEQAVACPVKYAMHFTELDELYAATGASPEKRLALLEQNHGTVLKRDDALSREIGLKVFAGKYDEAIQLMTGRTFSIWEGGRLDVGDQWVNAHLGRGRQELAAHKFADALADFQAAKNIPDNLPSEGPGSGGREAEFGYWIGNAYDGLGDKAKAAQSWQEAQGATSGGGRRGARGARGGSPDRQAGTYYQALARRQLGQTADAETALRGLLRAPNRGAGNAPESTTGRQFPNAQSAQAHYTAGLAHLGLGETDQARAEFELALRDLPDSLGPRMELILMR